MFCKCKRVDLQQFMYLMYLTYEKLKKKKKRKEKILYCNKTKYFLGYNRIGVLDICKKDSAKEKRSVKPKVFGILSNFKIFSTGFQTTVFYVTTWKLLNFETKISLEAGFSSKLRKIEMVVCYAHRGNYHFPSFLILNSLP